MRSPILSIADGNPMKLDSDLSRHPSKSSSFCKEELVGFWPKITPLDGRTIAVICP
jgi:hypothetical protein